MEVTIKWFDGKFPSFNIALSSQAGRDPFLEVKGCRIVSGKDGEFVAPPSTKGNNDKYWNHAYFSKDFAAVVLEKAKESQPKQSAPAKSDKRHAEDIDSDIPFRESCLHYGLWRSM